MANLKEIRIRIGSVSSTMQITSAMKMVSAAKLKKAQDAITAMRPYSNKLSELMKSLSGSSGDKLYSQKREIKNVLVIAISSNRGLCGAFNANIFKEITNFKSKDEFKNTNIDFLTIGKKINDSLSKNENVIQNDSELFDNLNYENVSLIAEKLMSLFLDQNYDHIELIYNSFKNAATQIIKSEQFLPIPLNESKTSDSLDYIFEPSQDSIISTLIPKSLKMQLFKAIRDSFASEHGARMTAMHKATDNASELRDELKLTYNKARQASITNEILEIVGGAEALNN
ncbi:ATP synthase F1 subunit gamma [Flavobacteriaceae bacterium]|nr:ATP synthase F1 subunit gamma [Flavobacteriaceae bacterium]MDC0210368.1 ATP synthase F1 subunit gamma [Flavobacteriaceae bacterium]RCL65016.1 MAG: ATP synthase F1 subunit gamma [Cryomorphaceae bacterium]|tara:strand:+ start:2906 stop:3760 length:855 start_codon:yes stop_codon:yes gene_type:complete